jgi:hypothetical protein
MAGRSGLPIRASATQSVAASPVRPSAANIGVPFPSNTTDENSALSATHNALPSGSLTASSSSKHRTPPRLSLYNGAQVAEPCVSDALTHLLAGCKHKIVTQHPEPCASNCRISDSGLANLRSQEEFACSICMERIVRASYNARRSAYQADVQVAADDKKAVATLAAEESSWERKAIEQLRRLKSGRRSCNAIRTSPTQSWFANCEFAVEAGGSDCSPIATEMSSQRPDGGPKLSARVATSMSRLPVPGTSPGDSRRASPGPTISRLPLRRR